MRCEIQATDKVPPVTLPPPKMEGDFHEAAVMGHDILDLSAGLDSVANLLELGSCDDSIYSSGLGIDDHHDGGMIDYGIIDSGRSVLDGDLGVSHIPLDGLIPLVAPHQLPTSPNSFGNARVKITCRDFVHLDGKDTASIDTSGNISSLLNDPIISTNLSTSQLASLGKIRTPSRDCLGKGNARLDNDDTSSFDATSNMSSLLNDPIVSTSLSTTQLASLGKVRTISSDLVGKGNTSLISEDATSFDTSGNVSSLFNDIIVSTSLSTTQLASSIKIRTLSSDSVGKGDTSLYSEDSTSIKATSNSSSSVSDTTNSSSLHVTTLKKARTPLKKSLETGVTLEQLKTYGHMQHLTHTPSLNARSKRNEHPSQTETGKSRTSGLIGTRFPKQNKPNNFRCSMCGAVYKSHELCVNHVLNRHKPGMAIKHQFPSNNSKNTQDIKSQPGARNSYVEPHVNGSNHAISEESVKQKSRSAIDSKMKVTESQQNPKVDTTANKDVSILPTTVRRAIKKANSEGGPATNSIFAKNLDGKITFEPIPSNCKRALLVLKSKNAVGLKPNLKKLPQNAKLTTTSIQRDLSRSKVMVQRPTCMKIINSSNDLATKSTFRKNLKPNLPCKRSQSLRQIASMKLKCKSPIYSKTTRTETSQNPRVIVITNNKSVEDTSRLPATMKRAVRTVFSQNDHARISKFGENLETDVDSKSGQVSCQIPLSKLKSQIAISSETKILSGAKGNTCTLTLTKKSDSELNSSSAFMTEDMGTQEIEHKSNWSDVSAVKKPKLSQTTSVKKRSCLGITEKREYGNGTRECKKWKLSTKKDCKPLKKRTKDNGGSTEKCVAFTEKKEHRARIKEIKKLKCSFKRTAIHNKDGVQKRPKEDSGSIERCEEKKEDGDRIKGTNKLKCSSKRGHSHRKHGAQNRTKKSGGSAESIVRCLDPKQLTIVICPQCQKAFTTYTGYSLHTTQVHNVSANNSPGIIKQLLVQRAPRYSNHTAIANLDEPQDNKHCGNDGIYQEREVMGICSSGYSVNFEEQKSHQVQIAETVDSSRTKGKDRSEGKLYAGTRETDNLALDEPPFSQDEDIVVSSEQISLRPGAFETSCSRPHADETKANGVGKVASRTCSLSVDLFPMMHRRSSQENSKTSKMVKEGSVLCSSCGVIFGDSSDLDGDHELASEPGELVCHWTALKETTTESLYLCSVCGVCIPSLSDTNSHSC